MNNGTIATGIPHEMKKLTHQIKCLNLVMQEANRLKRIELETNGIDCSEEEE